MNIEKNIKLSLLFDIYGKLLSEKQQNMLNCYVNNDMSLGEIAENENISRQAVLCAIKVSENKLETYEKLVGMLKLKNELEQAIKSDDIHLKNKITKILEEN